VDPAALVDRAFEAWLTSGGEPEGSHYVCLAVGKAARGMAAAAARRLGSRIREGLIITTEAGDALFPLVVGSHPVPTDASEQAGRRALTLAQSTAPGETLLVLLSGGASALMAVPIDGVTLADKARTTELLLKNGASITELNAVRKHLSAIKGGRLAESTSAPAITFAISDVVGDDLSVIGSGPTVADPSTFTDALAAIDRHGGRGVFPGPVVNHLVAGSRGGRAETPKTIARSSAARVIGSRHDAMAGAAQEARARGYDVHVSGEPVIGEARSAAERRLAAASAAERGVPSCLISSGETTVRVTGSGRGGRNQEFALAAIPFLAPLAATAALASVGTDGVDGPTDAAGAVVDSSTAARASAAGLSAARHLEHNDAYAFFHALGDLIQTGPTGTNVGDLQVILLA
jgi:hydroxypyruvate reductase